MAKKRCSTMIIPPRRFSGPRKKRIVINEHIEVGWEETVGERPEQYHKQVRIYVDDKPFLACSFLLVNLPKNEPGNEDITIEDLAEQPGARSLEGREAIGFTDDEGNILTEDDVLWGHASALQGWVEHDYNTMCLHANLSFPLLRELVRCGDAKAKRVLAGDIRDRLANGHRGTMVNILDTCSDIMDAEDWGILIDKWGHDVDVIDDVLSNPAVPRKILSRLVESPQVNVGGLTGIKLREAYISNPACTERDLMVFKEDRSPVIRSKLLSTVYRRSLGMTTKRNPYSNDVSEFIERSIFYDVDIGVRVAATRACVDPDALARAFPRSLGTGSSSILAELAKNRYLKEETMLDFLDEKWLKGEDGEVVLASLAGNPSVTRKVLGLLAKTKLPMVLETIHSCYLLSRSIPDARRSMHFKRMFVEVSDVNALGTPFALTVEGNEFHSFARRELLDQFMRRVGIKADIKPRGIGRFRKQYRVEGVFKQVEVAWSSTRLRQYAFEFGYSPIRLCVPILEDKQYAYRNGEVEAGNTSAMAEAIYRRGTIIYKTPTLALYEEGSVPVSDTLWRATQEEASDPPESIQRIYAWQKESK